MAKEIKPGIWMADRPEDERRETFTLTSRKSDTGEGHDEESDPSEMEDPAEE